MKFGLIGCGIMGTTVAAAMLNKGVLKKEDVIGSESFKENREAAAERLGIAVTESNSEVVEEADIVLLSVKPQNYPEVIDEIKGSAREGQIFITIAAGVSLADSKRMFGNEKVKVVRVNPNTPALVNQGVSLYCPNENVTEDELRRVLELLDALGEKYPLEESLFDIGTAVTGCAPAYVYMFIESMADAGVKGGLKRDLAYKLVSQAVLGSATMVLETGRHPADLKDAVCSPGGTTIEGVRALDENGFRGSIFKAITAVMEKTELLRK